MKIQTVFWASAAFSLLLAGWTVFCLIRKPLSKDDEKKPALWERVFLPAGKEIFIAISRRAGHTPRGIFPLYIRMMGETEGTRQYEIFQSRRIASLIALFLSFLLLMMAGTFSEAFREEDRSLDLQRGSYGSGTRTEKAVMTLIRGEETSSRKITLRIPARDMGEEEARKLINEALGELKAKLEGTEVLGKAVLPASSGSVAFRYLSLSPSLIRSDGLLLQEPGEERRTMYLRVTAQAGGYTQKEVLSFIQPALSDLSGEERASLLAKQVEDGRYLEEDCLALPEISPAGDTVVYEPDQEEHPEKVFGLLVLLLPALWLFQEREARKLWKKRDEKISLRFPELAGELIILARAGLSLSLCLMRLGKDYRKRREKGGQIDLLYEEVARTGEQIAEGISFREAVREMGERLSVPEARRLCHILLQNERKSNVYLLERLSELSEEAWEGRKKRVRELSETADTRLVFPLVLMMAVVLIVVLAPSLISLG